MLSTEMPPAIRAWRAQRKQARKALHSKEWREQRWRFALAAVVMSALLAGMLRAQIIPAHEAALVIYWPAGILITVFLAMGPVATERADRTWEFLVARPVSRADVLLAKWRVGLLQLLAVMAIATLTGALGMASRGFRKLPTEDLPRSVEVAGTWDGVKTWLELALVAHPIVWLLLTAMLSTVALACWYTPLFLLLTGARNEFTAALGGVLLTLAAHLWLAQIWLGLETEHLGLIITGVLNPLSPLPLAIEPASLPWAAVMGVVNVVVWIVLPTLLVRRRAGRLAL
jgi:hypothetical protein